MEYSELELNTQLTLIVTSDLHLRVPARFLYVSTDPYAVQVTFNITPDRGAQWTFARELLDQGLKTTAGTSDVRIAPIDPSQGHDFAIEFESPSGFARFEGFADPIKSWIARTYEVVPVGSESSFLEVDRFLDEVLAR
ncbi:SsgA family sporulation/cell division regulator [Streptomyces sp. NPDC096538]|uniref:SsgA family sporulation/cell division regulator n=1 Tax=Streptomyces sp. NPDC096538 TaxID=3155427 RepID=UPI00332771A9